MVLLAVWKACVNRNTQNILLLTETFECGFLRDLDILLKNKRKEKKRKKEIKENKKINKINIHSPELSVSQLSKFGYRTGFTTAEAVKILLFINKSINKSHNVRGKI